MINKFFKSIFVSVFLTSFLFGVHEPRSALQQVQQHVKKEGDDVESGMPPSQLQKASDEQFCPPTGRCCMEHCPLVTLFGVVVMIIGWMTFALVKKSHETAHQGMR